MIKLRCLLVVIPVLVMLCTKAFNNSPGIPVVHTVDSLKFFEYYKAAQDLQKVLVAYVKAGEDHATQLLIKKSPDYKPFIERLAGKNGIVHTLSISMQQEVLDSVHSHIQDFLHISSITFVIEMKDTLKVHGRDTYKINNTLRNTLEQSLSKNGLKQYKSKDITSKLLQSLNNRYYKNRYIQRSRPLLKKSTTYAV